MRYPNFKEYTAGGMIFNSSSSYDDIEYNVAERIRDEVKQLISQGNEVMVSGLSIIVAVQREGISESQESEVGREVFSFKNNGMTICIHTTIKGYRVTTWRGSLESPIEDIAFLYIGDALRQAAEFID